MMDPKRWARINGIFQRAFSLAPELRSAYLETVCAGDAALREEVEKLLAAAAVEDGFLENPPLGSIPIAELPTAHFLESGTQILHYEIIHLQGEGGMGTVYLARDLRLGRQVALKFIRREWQADATKLSRFLQEAKAASSLDHPNICTIHELESEDDRIFLVMAYYEGEPLQTKILERSLTLASILDYGMQAARGLAKAHAAGIVHRDVKPANLLVTSDGFLKILDFGIAKLLGEPSLTDTGDIVGTARYMSPEQLAGKPVDERSDVWSLGAVLSEMLDAASENESSPPRPGSGPGCRLALISGSRSDLREAIDCALQPDPSRRFQTMDMFLETLESIAFGSPSRVMRRAADIREKPSIAVLPLVNMHQSGEHAYFADGLTVELINQLARVPQLLVVSRTTAFQFKNSSVDMRELGRKLGVSAVLEGSVRIEADRVRIAVQLISTADGYNLWSERYDRTLSDIFAVQDELSRLIVKTLTEKLVSEAEERTKIQRTRNVEAYTLYLRGKHLLQDWNPAGNLQSIGLFRKALDCDGCYADAWAGLAMAEMQLGLWGHQTPRKAWAAVLEATSKALACEPDHAAARAIRGSVLVFERWDWTGAEADFQEAIALNRSDPDVRHMYISHYLLPMGRLEEAMQQLREMESVDPLSPEVHVLRGWTHLFGKRFGEAWQSARIAAELLARGPDAYWLGCLASVGIGQADTALQQLRLAEERVPGHSFTRSLELLAMVASGRKDEARPLVTSLVQRQRLSYVPLSHIGWAHVWLEEYDEAFQYFERAREEREMLITYLEFAPMRSAFRDDPRFSALKKSLGLA